MATKVYKSGYQVIVDEELKPYNKYTTATFCSFGFDGDNCWIKDIADTEEYIYNDNVDQMADVAGILIGDKEDVESYLLSFIGSNNSEDSITYTYSKLINYAESMNYVVPSSTQQALQNKLIIDLMSSGVWNEEDIFYMPANDGSEEFAALNWKDPSLFPLTKSGGVTWASNEGFSTSGPSTSYMKTGWATNSGKSDYTDQSISIFMENINSLDDDTFFGFANETMSLKNSAKMVLYKAFGHIYGSSNINNNTVQTSLVDIDGYNQIGNEAGSAFLHLKDNTIVKNVAATNLEPTTYRELYIGAYNRLGSPSGWAGIKIRNFSAGSAQRSLAQTKSDLINQYMLDI